jgi:membrane protein required for colicin V production
MTGFDIAVLLFVGFTAVIGFVRGFVQEILSIFAWFFAIFAIRQLHTPLTIALEPVIGPGVIAAILAFVLLLLVPYAFIKLVARWASERARYSMFGPIDRALGFGFGIVKGAIIVIFAFSLLLLAYDTMWGSEGRPAWMVEARSYRFINASSEALVTLIAERRREAGAVEEEAGAAEEKPAKKDG